MTLIDRITAALKGATPGPWRSEIHEGQDWWEVHEAQFGAKYHPVATDLTQANAALAALAPDMAAFITGLRQEWAVLLINPAGERWLPLDEDWYDSLEDANGEKERWIRRGYPDSHLVSRWVSNPEVDA